jgi:hypothetical protein
MLSLVGAGAPGRMLQRRGSMNIGCGGYWKGVEGVFWIRGPTGAKTSARALGTERRESYGWKLFHREERPALERDIIDTSEWTCAKYRYVLGQHFGL